jgi:hypothetical protein
MNYWITTHYPHPIPDKIPWLIFLKKPRELLPAIGERVFFYETIVTETGDGEPGRRAIVCKALVSGKLEPNRFSKSKTWPYMIRCHGHQDCSISLNATRAVVARPFFRSSLCSISEGHARKLEAACPG